MANCVVIGGGLAGISAAVNLTKLGHKVELIEASPKLGGRTYSYLDKETKTEIDNGQHVLMGMYNNTFELLDIIGSKDNLKFQSSLEIEFLRNEVVLQLRAPKLFYPFNLFIALIKFGAFSPKEKFHSFSFLAKVFLKQSSSFSEIDALTWLKQNSQSENNIASLWEIICISALNTSLNQASAKAFHNVLKKVFFSGEKAARMVLTNKPLTRTFVDPAINYFNKNKIEYHISETVKELVVKNNIVTEIKTENRVLAGFDSVVLAIPHYLIEKIKSAKRLLNEQYFRMETSPIITIHIWEKKKSFSNSFVGLIDSNIHWVFNNDSHLSVVISAAEELINKSHQEIIELVAIELNKANSSFVIANILNYKVIKEKRATLKCTPKNEKLREFLKTDIKNLVFAGDWTNTQLPGTIEGAILSGKLAAVKINSQKK
jgi:squalene-associated FAD-dependent desaturase